MNDRTPFLGVYENAAGELIDMASGAVITAADIKVPMSPFYGVFFDKDGNIHSLEELSTGGGGSGGTTNYNLLTNRPKIHGTTLAGDQDAAQLGLAAAPLGISGINVRYVDAATGNDANNGLTAATAWQTLPKALDAMKSQLFAADMRYRILMAPGTYSLPTGWSNIDNPFNHDLELAGNTAAGATRDNTIITVGGTGLRLRAKYVLAHDFTVRNPNSLTAASILLDVGQVAYLYNIILSYEAVRGAGAAGLVYNAAKVAIFNVQFTNCGRGAYAYGGLLQYDNLTESSGNGVMFRAEGGTIVNGADLPASMVTNKIFDGDDSGLYVNELAKKSDIPTHGDIRALISNPNILHNSDFRNPVNQRGQTTISVAGSMIDRWYTTSTTYGTISQTSNGLSLAAQPTNCWLCQLVEFPVLYDGETVTLSVEIDSYENNPILLLAVYNGTSYIIARRPTLREGIISATGVLSVPSAGMLRVIVGCETQGSVVVKRVKLEKGAVSTLANDPPSDYGKGLSTCQRFQNGSNIATHSYFRAVDISANMITFMIPVEQTMRTNPRIVQLDGFEMRLYSGLYDLTAQTGFTYQYTALPGHIRVQAIKSNHGLSDARLVTRGTLFDSNI